MAERLAEEVAAVHTELSTFREANNRMANENAALDLNHLSLSGRVACLERLAEKSAESLVDTRDASHAMLEELISTCDAQGKLLDQLKKGHDDLTVWKAACDNQHALCKQRIDHLHDAVSSSLDGRHTSEVESFKSAHTAVADEAKEHDGSLTFDADKEHDHIAKLVELQERMLLLEKLWAEMAHQRDSELLVLRSDIAPLASLQERLFRVEVDFRDSAIKHAEELAAVHAAHEAQSVALSELRNLQPKACRASAKEEAARGLAAEALGGQPSGTGATAAVAMEDTRESARQHLVDRLLALEQRCDRALLVPEERSAQLWDQLMDRLQGLEERCDKALRAPETDFPQRLGHILDRLQALAQRCDSALTAPLGLPAAVEELFSAVKDNAAASGGPGSQAREVEIEGQAAASPQS